MKKNYLTILLFCLAKMALGQAFYNLDAGDGNGLRFWNGSNSYKIHMGNSAEYHYGPVTSYSIKMNMSANTPTRGWTWGEIGKTPIASLNTTGDFQLADDMVILGNLAIGLTTTDYRLQTAGGVRLRKTAIGATSASAANSWIRDEWLTGSYGPPVWNEPTQKWVRPGGTYNDVGGVIYQDEGTYFIRDKAGSQLEYSNQELLEKAFIFAKIADGNVGIGTITPDAKLAVNGTVHAKEVKIDLLGWPDYVFSKEYDLPQLREVEEYITKNGHLPNIPSAKDVEENGIHLGEMNKLLLEKIEEQMLYILELNKKLEQQGKELETLKEMLKN